MRTTLGIFISVLLLSGCSPKHTSYVDQTIEVVPGKDIVVRDYVLSVRKRDGSSLEGIRIVRREPDGKETIITADTGMMTQGPKQSVEMPVAKEKARYKLSVVIAQNTVRMTLFNAHVQMKTQAITNRMIVEKMEFEF